MGRHFLDKGPNTPIVDEALRIPERGTRMRKGERFTSSKTMTAWALAETRSVAETKKGDPRGEEWSMKQNFLSGAYGSNSTLVSKTWGE